MLSKACSKCKKELPTTEFGPCKATKSGLASWCRPCVREHSRRWYANNQDKHREAVTRWAERNPDKIAQYQRTSRRRRRKEIAEYRKLPRVRAAETKQHREYVRRNRDRILEHQRQWYAKNPHVFILHSRIRRQTMRLQQAWMTPENASKIADIYRECRQISEQTGIPHEVDHVMPVNGVDSCGLHVPWNLRIVTRAVNRSKGNRVAAA